jgi:hypothetical protein
MLQSNCEEPTDQDAYIAFYPSSPNIFSRTWPYISTTWAYAVALNDGVVSANASNARLLTQFIPTNASLPLHTPSIAEALAVMSGCTLLQSIANATFVSPGPSFTLGSYQQFNASVITQQYTSAYTQSWQVCFYPMLAIVFLINLFCIVYTPVRPSLMTDYTEPQNLFALAINSPPSDGMVGSCGAGHEGDQFGVPWFVCEDKSAPHYFIHDAQRRNGSGNGTALEVMSPRDTAQKASVLSTASTPYQRLTSKPKRIL